MSNKGAQVGRHALSANGQQPHRGLQPTVDTPYEDACNAIVGYTVVTLVAQSIWGVETWTRRVLSAASLSELFAN